VTSAVGVLGFIFAFVAFGSYGIKPPLMDLALVAGTPVIKDFSGSLGDQDDAGGAYHSAVVSIHPRSVDRPVRLSGFAVQFERQVRVNLVPELIKIRLAMFLGNPESLPFAERRNETMEEGHRI
jgi:hypothetical protein